MALKKPVVYYTDTGRFETLRSGDTLDTSIYIPGNVTTPFSVSGTFTRPADTTAYAIGDGVNNSTTVPTVFTVDTNMTNGSAIIVTGVRVVSTTSRSSAQPMFNLWVKPVTYTISNDNAAFAISDADAQAECHIIPVMNVAYTANNTINSSGAMQEQIKLDASNDTLYCALQTMNAFTPTSAEVFTIWVEGYVIS